MQQNDTFTRDLVLVGGGHAHALVLRMWGMRRLAGARLTLIDPGPTAPYTGMLPGFVAGHYGLDDMEIDLHRLCRFAQARLVVGSVKWIDQETGHLLIDNGQVLAYDVLSINIGIHSSMPEVTGFSEHAVPAKPMGEFASAWTRFLGRVKAGETKPLAAVIGGGVAGIELAMSMSHSLQARSSTAVVTLIEERNQIALGASGARRGLSRALASSGVRVITGAVVAAVNRDAVVLGDGERVASTFTVGAAGARAHAWLPGCGLPLTEDGFLPVRPDLRVDGLETVFAVGDCAHLVHAPRAKAGVYSVRAAPVLYNNLRAVLSGNQLRTFQPQKTYLKLVSLGRKSALAEKWGMAVAGPILWKLKDRIDRRFIRRLTELPDMPLPQPPRVRALGGEDLDQPLCGGCGGKVVPTALREVLSGLSTIDRPDIVFGPGDDAAVIGAGDLRLALSSDHLRAFTEDYGVFSRIAALHALGDIWAMGAKPQSALVNLTMPRMSERLQKRTMQEIMFAVEEVLTAAGAAIIGGHSSLGTELSIGFSITGLLDSDPITTSGARADDILVLSRPIGTGTLLTADMRGLTGGREMRALFELLLQPQDSAAHILRNCNAMTDVTGFGLAGHLSAMCRASRVGAVLDLTKIPFHPRAVQLAEAGVRSTIWKANRAASPVLGAECQRGVLLHDPQTAGGFLASIDASNAERIVQELRLAGYEAAAIGHLVDSHADIVVAS